MKTILIAEREYECHGLADFLERSGYPVMTATDARSALALIRSGARIDLVICELLFPDMDGMEFLAGVRRIDPLLPIIVATSICSIEKYLQSMGLGVTEYFPKPLVMREVLRIVRMILNPAGVAGLMSGKERAEELARPAAS